jgi:EAL domain-containing protein (putative c-di-GMP-specific phosphodiesterase class I)
VASLLQRSGLEPRYLQLEITEGLLMDDPDRALEVIDRLHALGVGICIDDFGTGYSSLGYLKELPACEIKIDKSFVRQMDEDPDDAVIVRSTIEMAHALKQTVVAEGVETERTWCELRRFGCDLVQGFYFSPPLPSDRLQALILGEPWGLGPTAALPPVPAGHSPSGSREGAPVS